MGTTRPLVKPSQPEHRPRRVDPRDVIYAVLPGEVGWWGCWNYTRKISVWEYDRGRCIVIPSVTVYYKTESGLLDWWLFWWGQRDQG